MRSWCAVTLSIIAWPTPLAEISVADSAGWRKRLRAMRRLCISLLRAPSAASSSGDSASYGLLHLDDSGRYCLRVVANFELHRILAGRNRRQVEYNGAR